MCFPKIALVDSLPAVSDAVSETVQRTRVASFLLSCGGFYGYQSGITLPSIAL